MVLVNWRIIGIKAAASLEVSGCEGNDGSAREVDDGREDDDGPDETAAGSSSMTTPGGKTPAVIRKSSGKIRACPQPLKGHTPPL